jgi:hypothetical protein
MHMGMLAHAVMHATIAGVLGFFVLFAASKASGVVKLVGTLLGWWLWILALLSIVCVFVCPMMGDKLGEKWGMHGDWMHSSSTAAPAANAAAPAKPDAAPAAPATATPPPKKP